jgi:Protein of unknown function DUF104
MAPQAYHPIDTASRGKAGRLRSNQPHQKPSARRVQIPKQLMDNCPQPVKINQVTAIRVIFDGKAFIPQQPVSLPDKSEALVIVEQNDPSAHAQLDSALRAYYENKSDAEDDAWGNATSPQSQPAWDED